MLQISHLSFSYHDQIIFQNLNLSFSAPEIIAIIGDNGAGKSTLFQMIPSSILLRSTALPSQWISRLAI